MKKTSYTFIILMLAWTYYLQGQESSCGFDQLNGQADQNYQSATSNLNQAYLDWMEGAPHSGSYDIPIVFHIMHNNGPENISDSQILQALEQANSQLNGSEGGYDTGITLKLATLDPHGNCTSGINRVQTPNPNGSISFYNDSSLKDLSRWDPSKYLNVWIVKGIGLGIAGYTYLPSVTTVNEEEDGIVIQYNYLGETGSASDNEINTLAHELGHYLGLYHVWGDKEDDCGNNCHDYNLSSDGVENCLAKGDWVCDTNPALEADFTPDCSSDISSCQSCPIDEMLPYPKENYMSYSHSCQDKFTNGQAERMWFILEKYRSGLWSSENLLCTGIGEHYGHNISITEDEIWSSSTLPNDGHIIITGTLTIESDASLTIEHSNVKIHFCEYGKIVIKPGGKLINEGTLTNACQAPWKGIEVWGNSDVTQGDYFSHPKHGLLVLRQEAIVENAEVAVKLYGPDYMNNGGGLISASETTFANNGTAVHFAPYDLGGDYSASFSGCTFVSDGSLVPFSSFLDMNDVKGIKISSSSFTYTGGPSFGQGVERYRYGIWAKNSGFKLKSTIEQDKFGNNIGVGRCSFFGLGYGIHITNLLGNKYYEIEQAIFENCYTGIYNSGMSLGKILFNDFNLGKVPDPSLIDDTDAESQIGIHLENPISGITFQQNDFTANNSTFNTTGSIIEKIGDFNNYIRKNNFNSNTFGNIATGNNGTNYPWTTGVRYFCNILTDTKKYDFAIPDTPEPDKINKNQGVFDLLLTLASDNIPVYKSSGNKFSYNGYLYGDFFNEGGVQTLYWYEEGAPNEEPLDFYKIIPSVTEHTGDCVTIVCEPPCPPIHQEPEPDISGLKTQFIEVENEYLDFIENHFGPEGIPSVPHNPFSDSPIELLPHLSPLVAAMGAYYQTQMDDYTQEALQIIASNPSGIDFHAYVWWISKIGSYEGDLWLAREYAAIGNWAVANNLLNEILVKYNLVGEALQDFNNLRTIFSILQAESYNSNGIISNVSQLRGIAHLNYGYAPAWANNILNSVEYNLPIHYYIPSLKTENRAIQQNTKISDDTLTDFKIYPNPASQVVYFKSNKTLEGLLDVQLYDLSGKLSLSTVLNDSHSVDLSGLQPGVYILTVSTNQKNILSDRLVLVK